MFVHYKDKGVVLNVGLRRILKAETSPILIKMVGLLHACLSCLSHRLIIHGSVLSKEAGLAFKHEKSKEKHTLTHV